MFFKSKGRTWLAGVLSAMIFVPADSATSALSTQVDANDLVIVKVQTIPIIDPNQLVFVCEPVPSSAGTVACGLVEARRLMFIGAEQAVRSVLVDGSLLRFGLYPVQGCYRHYAMVWPNPLDEHFTDPELAADVGLSGALIGEGFPSGTCQFQTEPLIDSIVTVSVE